jgi:DeoR family ulaG and ulaABCDEF operon transcriptional repressor
MHETERHRAIMAALAAKPLLSLADLAGLTGASEATVRRDVVRLHGEGRLTRVRGGARSLSARPGDAPPPSAGVARLAEKRAIARAAAALCETGDAIIINGGTTTYQMVHPLASARLQVFTNSFPVADYLLRHSRNSVLVPSGAIYRDQNIILSPYAEDGSRHFRARRMFVGTRSLGPHGLAETDPLLVQAVQRLLDQAEQIVVLADSSKFAPGAGLQVCPLDRVGVLVTDPGIADRDAAMVERAGLRLIVADPAGAAEAPDGTG